MCCCRHNCYHKVLRQHLNFAYLFIARRLPRFAALFISLFFIDASLLLILALPTSNYETQGLLLQLTSLLATTGATFAGVSLSFYLDEKSRDKDKDDAARHIIAFLFHELSTNENVLLNLSSHFSKFNKIPRTVSNFEAIRDFSRALPILARQLQFDSFQAGINSQAITRIRNEKTLNQTIFAYRNLHGLIHVIETIDYTFGNYSAHLTAIVRNPLEIQGLEEIVKKLLDQLEEEINISLPQVTSAKNGIVTTMKRYGIELEMIERAKTL